VASLLLKTEGASGLFKGIAAPLATSAAYNALCFQVYASAGRALSRKHGEPLSYLHSFLAGCAAGAATTLMVTPVDLIKIAQQTTAGRAAGTVRIARNIVRREGVLGLFRGAPVTLLRDVPSTGVYYAAYDASRDALGSRHSTGANASTLLAGSLAGCAAWLSIYPLDVIKSRQQADPHMYKGWVDCARRSVAKEGWRVLWRGLPACLLRAAVVNAFIFGAYEASMELLVKPPKRGQEKK